MDHKRIAKYIRVSTRGQGEDDRYGLATQEDAIDKMCAANGYVIVAQYKDVGFSGMTANRPALASLLENASKRLFDAVVVFKLDRLARNLTLDGYLRFILNRHGVAILSASEKDVAGEEPTAKLTQAVLAAVGEFERHLIAQRLSAAKALKKLQGGYSGGRPRYGQRASGKSLITDDDEAATIDFMRELRTSGKSFGEIALKLNAKQILPRHARCWDRATISQILRRSEGHRMA